MYMFSALLKYYRWLHLWITDRLVGSVLPCIFAFYLPHEDSLKKKNGEL